MLIASAEFDAMKTGARFVNIARGSMVDQDALHRRPLKGGRLRSAFIDVTDPEPLPGGSSAVERAQHHHHHAHVRARQPRHVRTGGERFADNVRRYLPGSRLEAVADLERGY